MEESGSRELLSFWLPPAPCPIYSPRGCQDSPQTVATRSIPGLLECLRAAQSHSSGLEDKGRQPSLTWPGSSDLCYQPYKNSLLLAILGHGNPQRDTLF